MNVQAVFTMHRQGESDKVKDNTDTLTTYNFQMPFILKLDTFPLFQLFIMLQLLLHTKSAKQLSIIFSSNHKILSIFIQNWVYLSFRSDFNNLSPIPAIQSFSFLLTSSKL